MCRWRDTGNTAVLKKLMWRWDISSVKVSLFQNVHPLHF